MILALGGKSGNDVTPSMFSIDPLDSMLSGYARSWPGVAEPAGPP